MIMRKTTTDACFCSTGTYYGGMRDSGAYALTAEASELACEGVRAASAAMQIGIPADMDRSRIHAIRNHAKKGRARLEEAGFAIESFQIRGTVNAALAVPEVTVTLMGTARAEETTEEIPRAGQQILQVGWIGLEGMLRIIGEREGELKKRFTPAFLGQMKAYDDELFKIDRLEMARAAGIRFIRQIGAGGILAALHDLADETQSGIRVDLNRIAIRQETIEVCEYYRINPYQLASAGSFLMLSKDAEAFERLKAAGIPAAVIGQTTGDHDKVIHNGEDIRYIDRPAPDELYKVIRKGE